LIFLVALVLASVAASVRTGATFSDTIVVVTALIGVFALYAESRRGKTIAMGEFILNLNSEFDSHPDRARVHRKIIAGEPLGRADQPAIVAYLTFFEIVYRLVLSGMLRMDVIDDLFRSRFFKAVHHVDVQELELLPDADGYRNIYELEELWLAHLKRTRSELKRGDRRLPASARRRALQQVHFDFTLAAADEALAVHAFIVRAVQTAAPADFFLNDLDTVAAQMRGGVTLKAFLGEEMAGILHVHFPEAEESYAHRVGNPWSSNEVAHMDIAAVLPKFRGFGLLELMLLKAEEHLRDEHPGRRVLYATVSPGNAASMRSFAFARYEKVAEVTIHDSYPRHVLRKVVRGVVGADACQDQPSNVL
jgi:hypothetical protein